MLDYRTDSVMTGSKRSLLDRMAALKMRSIVLVARMVLEGVLSEGYRNGRTFLRRVILKNFQWRQNFVLVVHLSA